MIFELCFDLSCAFGYVHNDTDPPDDLERKDNNWCKTPSILLVSHQVHSEASAVLYNKELVFTSGCRPFVFVRSVSKILLQKLRKVTFNMDLCRCAKWDFPFQRRWGEPSPWGELFLLLDAVWGQGHNLQRLRFTFRGSEEKMLHEPWIATFVLEDLIRRILNSFPRVEGIPHIEVCDLIDWRPRSSTKQYLLHGLELYTMMLKNEDPSAEERLNDYVWHEPSDINGRILPLRLLFPQFMH